MQERFGQFDTDLNNINNAGSSEYKKFLQEQKEKLSIQSKDYKLKKYDTILLCTDGVYNEVSDEYLKNKLSDGISAETLISEILIQEPKDNLSAIIINVV